MMLTNGFRDRLAELVGIDRDVLAIEVRFHAVTDRFVQQDARAARAHDDGHFSRRRLIGFEQNHRLRDGIVYELIETSLRVVVEVGARGAIR